MLKILTERIEGKATAVNYITVYGGTVWFTKGMLLELERLLVY